MSDISTEATEALNDLRTEIADALRTIPGLSVIEDPSRIKTPCCLVGLPRVTRVRTMTSTVIVDAVLPVTLMAPLPADAASAKWLLSMLIPVMRIIRADDATPAVDAETGETLPAYPLTISKSLKIEENGS